MRRSSIVVGLAAMLGVFGGAMAGSAQDATPAAEPIIVPAANQCTVAPRDIAFFDQMTATPAASPVASPVAELRAGEPADRTVRAAVLDTVRQALACTNAGNLLALYALHTDAFITANPPSADDLAAMAADPAPPTGDLASLWAIEDVQTLDDGRVIVIVHVVDPRSGIDGLARATYVMVEQDGRYLIDAATSAPLDSAATPAA